MSAPATPSPYATAMKLGSEVDGLRAQASTLTQQRDELLAALKDLTRAYVNMLESARERILSFGGDCDSVAQMERADPRLKAARDAIAKASGDQLPQQEKASD